MSPFPHIAILHEDREFVVIDKPPVLDSQASRPDRPSVAQWLEDRCGFAGLVHRLDFNTTGAMILAKSSGAAARATKALQQGLIQRSYYGSRPSVGRHHPIEKGYFSAGALRKPALELKLGTNQIRRLSRRRPSPRRASKQRLRPPMIVPTHSHAAVGSAQDRASLPEDLQRLAQRLRKPSGFVSYRNLRRGTFPIEVCLSGPACNIGLNWTSPM